jgi:cell filamentation protein
MTDRSIDPYVYPGTEVLRNKLNILDSGKLNVAEADISSVKIMSFLTKPVPKTVSFRNLLSIHKFLFEEVYDWAGKPRTVDIQKGPTTFCRADFITQQAEKLCGQIQSAGCFKGLPQSDFIKEFAHVYNEMNVIHPFREGNGRSTRLFFNQVAAIAGYQIDYGKISRDEWTDACIHTSPTQRDLRRFSRIAWFHTVRRSLRCPPSPHPRIPQAASSHLKSRRPHS